MSTVLIDLENTLLDRSRSIEHFAKELLADFESHLDSHSVENIELVIVGSEQDGYRARNARFTTAKEAIANGLASKLRWKRALPIGQLENYWSERFPLHACPMPGAEELLLKLKDDKHTVAILSNGCHRSRVSMMDTLGFTPLIQELFSSESLKTSKPDSQAFKIAVSRLGSTCEASFHVGDHPFNDILGAQRVGITPIWLQGSHPWPEHIPTPTFKVTHLTDVVDIIKKRKGEQPASYNDAGLQTNDSGHQFA